jgi:L-malate glycosyltransferase
MSDAHTDPPRSSKSTYLLVLPWGLDAIGGVTRVVVGLYDGIRRDGRLQPRILQLSWESSAPQDDLYGADYCVTRFRIRNPLSSGSFVLGALRYCAFLPAEMWRIAALVRRYDITVVNSHYIGSAEFTWALAKALGIYRGKLFFSLHGLDIRTIARLGGIRRRLWRWALRQADAVVACSEGLAQEAASTFRLSTPPVVTIHNGVDIDSLLDTVAAARSHEAEQALPNSLLNLATFEHKKGHDVLLRAFRRVVDGRPDAHLTIMGRRADTSDATLRLVSDLGLDSNVSIRIDAPHKVALHALAGTEIFVLSSRNEAFSVALLEAGALGKPVVATNVCGVPELIEDGVTGILVPSEDDAALAHGILRLLTDKSLAAACGRQLRERVQSKFTGEVTCRNYLRLAGYGS